MPSKSSIMIDLDDPRTEEIAEAISNKTSKQILSLIAEQELSETQIAEKLALPLNTIDYNIKKLESAGLIEKAKTFSWSPKGKAVYRYTASNKKIIISPKKLSKGILPAIAATLLGSIAIKLFLQPGPIQEESMRTALKSAPAADLAEGANDAAGAAFQAIDAIPSHSFWQNILSYMQEPWLIFLIGGLVAILALVLYNKFKKDD
jgi:DNA-binding transcriptional ArsR family regulator